MDILNIIEYRYRISLLEIQVSRYQDLLSGFIRLHVLYHASKEEVFGLGLIEELRGHGYKLSPGTIYPMLHGMEQKGYLRSRELLVDSKQRKLYSITAEGEKALQASKRQLKELFHELDEKH